MAGGVDLGAPTVSGVRKTTLEPEQVRSAVAERLGLVTDVRPLVEGEVSQAFALLLDGEPHVARVAPDSADYDTERFVLDRLVPPDVPVAPIVDVWALDAEHVLCVSRRLPGVVVDRCSDDAARRIAPDVVQVHRALASADVSGVSGFGTIDAAAGGARFASWAEYLLVGVDEPVGLPESAGSGLTQARRALAAVTPACPDVASLVHGDFGGDNLLTDGAAVTGVIDWAQALIGDPVMDVAWSVFWGEWVAPMRIHGEAMWATWRDEPDADVRLRACALRIGLGAARYYVRKGEPETASSMIERTRQFM
jgi:hygromycin-B 4-O-kinase